MFTALYKDHLYSKVLWLLQREPLIFLHNDNKLTDCAELGSLIEPTHVNYLIHQSSKKEKKMKSEIET